GLYILPAGVLNRALGRTLGRCVAAALAAALVGFLLLALPMVAIPATALTYFATLRLLGELDPELLMLTPPWLGNALRPWLERTR
ncbi:MAG: hypothetical protein ABI880_03650, partial [Acidobacteriota bacterium]